MGYLPNLIPEEHRVLKEYFRAGKGKDAPKIKWPLAAYLLSALFLIAALASLAHPIVFIAFASLSWIISPPGHKWLERKFQFKFLTKVKLIFCAAMYIAILPLAAYYNTQDEMEASLLKIKEAKELKEKTLAEKRDKLRKDSLDQILTESLRNKRSSESSLRQLAYELQPFNFFN